MDQSLTIYLVAGLAFVSVLGIGFVLTSGGTTASQQKRLKQVSTGTVGKKNATQDPSVLRKKQMQESVKALREREAKRRKDNDAKSLKDKLQQAGWTIEPGMFWLISIAVGAGFAFVGFLMGLSHLVIAAIGFAGAFGLPRWAVGVGIGMRQKKFSTQFADAIDVVVRGVKSGLPLIECLRIIARESPSPLRDEFERVVDSLQMGATMDRALDKMYRRMPLPEVNFFNIVIGIQQQAGGNLSEALGNLSEVLRSRKMLGEKVKALSAEAKASAMIIGSLPIAVMGLVYVTSPDYITTLFVTSTGNFILLIGAGLMGLGIFVMKQMMSFDH